MPLMAIEKASPSPAKAVERPVRAQVPPLLPAGGRLTALNVPFWIADQAG